MKRKIAAAALPFLIVPCHALVLSGAAACRTHSDSLAADSIRRTVREGIALREAVVNGNGSEKERQMRSSLNTVSIGRPYMDDNFGGSLMQTLAKLPGVQSMQVGSGASKPMIRGLGFNRVLVAENGIRHEGQQWGDDHGLETDQYAVDGVEVTKGPATLAYGSDAIGGVINLRDDGVPQERFGGRMNVFIRSNNASVGTALRVTGRNGRFWYKANATLIDYADYRVPADSIPYYSYYIKLPGRRLRNTAGRETDGSLLAGYEGRRLKAYLRLSDVNTRSGFFADAHGLEVRLSDIDYDRSTRDTDPPYHTSNHLFVSGHTAWHWQEGMAEGTVAWQDNRQREYAEPVSHGYMPVPPNTLERAFDKHTLSVRLHLRQRAGAHIIHAGGDVEYQYNDRGGWGFILPAFRQLQWGAYVSDRFIISERLVISAGLRYDYGSVRIHRYRDWYKTPVSGGDSVYTERSADRQRTADCLTWSVGVNRRLGSFVLKANVGKSFRMPIAKELGMDGINYNIFRYEKGNADLKPEVSYQADAGVSGGHGAWIVSFTPYLNYFPNYIYLTPTADYREGLQLYYYTQCRILRYGTEATLAFRFLRRFELSAGGEFLRSRQLSGEKKGYTLPYSPPWSARVELRYSLPAARQDEEGFAAVEYVIAGRQDEVVPPEEPTSGHQLLNVSAGKSFPAGRTDLRLTLRCENLLGEKYFDHTSYYRLIGVPEPGRNFSLMAAWNF